MTATQRPRSTTRWTLPVAGVALVVLGAVALTEHLARPEPAPPVSAEAARQTAVAFTAAVAADDWETECRLRSVAGRAHMAVTQCVGYRRVFGSRWPPREVDVASAEGRDVRLGDDGRSATATVGVEYRDGARGVVRLHMSVTGGRWEVDRFLP